MGAYLSEPITEKVSSDEDGERVRYGASSMQGWRVTQEDAHNCIVDYDANSSFFAVYDGHGGHEVAQYCSQNLPEFVKRMEAYKKGDYSNALIDAFLDFDATIATPEVMAVLKTIAGVKDDEDGGVECASDDDASVSSLYEEAAMPIEQVMEKYQSNLVNPNVKKLQGEKQPTSPYLRARRAGEGSGESSGSCTGESSSSIGADTSDAKPDSSNDDKVSSTDDSKSSNGDAQVVSGSAEAGSAADSSEDHKDQQNKKKKKNNTEADAASTKHDENVVSSESNVNGEVKGDDDNVSSSTAAAAAAAASARENGEVSSPKGKGKGKALAKSSPAGGKQSVKRSSRLKFLNKMIIECQEDETSSEDENDESFEGGAVDNSSSEDGAAEGEEEEGDEEDDDDDEEDDDDDEEAEDEDEEDEDDEDGVYASSQESPGSDSGCTAVVALLVGPQLFVANAGDSRCVVCREGTAIEMSQDHKPEDEPEMERIVRAGGHVTCDGRVDGGLNLSRAIGDHVYKANKELSAREQMITALPDIRTATIDPAKDEFMVLACDGIWNHMSSQEVVDFVRARLSEGRDRLSQICEELFEACLAPNTLGDGTGCDNMTAVIVKFKPAVVTAAAAAVSSKRDREDETGPEPDSEPAKRQKTDPVSPPT